VSTFDQLQRGLACRHPRQTYSGVPLACAVIGCPRGHDAPELVIAIIAPLDLPFWTAPAGELAVLEHEKVWLRRVPLSVEPFVEWGR
jgi:hypothetical protein